MPLIPPAGGDIVPASNLELANLWVNRFRSPHTQRAYAKDIQEFFAFLGPKTLPDVTLLDLQNYEASMLLARQERPLSDASINRKLSAAKSLLSFACELRVLSLNVGAMMKNRPMKEKLNEYILTEAEVAQVIEGEPDFRNRIIMRFLYQTGCRVAELCGLKWRDLRMGPNERGLATLYGKGNKTRTVILPTPLWLEVQELRGDSGANDPVFRSIQGYPIDCSQVFRMVRRAGKRVELEANISPHWLRHAHASHALDRGAPLHLVQQTLGHASISTTTRYLHARPSDSSSLYLME